MNVPEPVIPDSIPADALPDLLRNWHLGSRARRHLSRRRFAAVTGLLGSGRGERALDVGCGWGYNLFLLDRSGYGAFGVDIVQNDFPAATEVLGANRCACNLAGADVGALPFLDGVFSAVTAVETFEHVYAPDRERAVREIARVLAAGGSLVLSTPNYTSLVEWGKRILVRFPSLKRLFPPMCYPAGEITRDEYHPYRYHKPLPYGELAALLENGGFTVRSIKRVLLVWKNIPDALFPFARLFEGIIERIPLLNRICSTLVVYAERKN